MDMIETNLIKMGKAGKISFVEASDSLFKISQRQIGSNMLVQTLGSIVIEAAVQKYNLYR